MGPVTRELGQFLLRTRYRTNHGAYGLIDALRIINSISWLDEKSKSVVDEWSRGKMKWRRCDRETRRVRDQDVCGADVSKNSQGRKEVLKIRITNFLKRDSRHMFQL